MPPIRTDPTVVALVEGPSDVVVVRALAAARGMSEQEGDYLVVSMGGVTNIGHHLERHLRQDGGRPVVGLCDAGEEAFVRRALRRHGHDVPTRSAMARAGFFVCDADLEDELIRALGVECVDGVLADMGEARRLRTFRNQPEWRCRTGHEQLHRFAGSGSGRKAALAGRLAALLTTETTPPPLAALVDRLATLSAVRAGEQRRRRGPTLTA